MEYTILGLDPGSSNFGWSVVRVKVGKTFHYKVLANGKIEKTLHSLKDDVLTDINVFKAEIRKILRTYKPTHLIAERFMTRGIKGATIEYISVMLGVLTQMGIKNIRFITAAQWKNRWNRHYRLDDFYKRVGIEDHQVDATNIALYGAAIWHGAPYFDYFASEAELIKFIKRLEDANQGKVIKRKVAKPAGKAEGRKKATAARGQSATRVRRRPAKAPQK